MRKMIVFESFFSHFEQITSIIMIILANFKFYDFLQFEGKNINNVILSSIQSSLFNIYHNLA